MKNKKRKLTSKGKSIILYSVFAFIAALGVVLSVCSFPIAGTYYNYAGFASSIKLGLDLEGGIEVVYEASVEDGQDFDTALNATINRITNLLTNEGYSEATVTKQNGNQIRVEVADVDDPQDILDVIGEPAKLTIRTSKATDIASNIVIDASNIVNVYSGYDSSNSKWGVTVKFDETGALAFKNATSEASSSNPIVLYIYNGTTLISSPQAEEVISNGSTFISGNMSSQAEAEAFALKIESGTFNCALTLISNSTVSATLGEDALYYGIIAGLIGLLLIFLFMILVYRDLGIIASFSLIFYVILMLFFLQALPNVQLTIAGIAGIILSLGMAVDANIVIFERSKDEYRSGKKISAACKSGYKKAFWSIFDSNITTIIASIVLYILGTGSIKGFALTLLIGIVISMFTSLVLTNTFVKWYLPFNEDNAKRLNLKREAQENETK